MLFRSWMSNRNLLNHQVSKCSSYSSTMWLHSKLLLSHKPSRISTRRISLETHGRQRHSRMSRHPDQVNNLYKHWPGGLTATHTNGLPDITCIMHTQKCQMCFRTAFNPICSAQPYLVSYLDSFLSSHAVFPPPKFFFAVFSNPCVNKSHPITHLFMVCCND